MKHPLIAASRTVQFSQRNPVEDKHRPNKDALTHGTTIPRTSDANLLLELTQMTCESMDGGKKTKIKLMINTNSWQEAVQIMKAPPHNRIPRNLFHWRVSLFFENISHFIHTQFDYYERKISFDDSKFRCRIPLSRWPKSDEREGDRVNAFKRSMTNLTVSLSPAERSQLTVRERRRRSFSTVDGGWEGGGEGGRLSSWEGAPARQCVEGWLKLFPEEVPCKSFYLQPIVPVLFNVLSSLSVQCNSNFVLRQKCAWVWFSATCAPARCTLKSLLQSVCEMAQNNKTPKTFIVKSTKPMHCLISI